LRDINRSGEKVLVIKLGAFGDVVQADGVLRDIRAFHAHDEIVLLTTPPFRKLMQRCPHVDRILAAPRAPFWKIGEWVRLARLFRNEQFTRVYDLQKQGRTRLYRRLFFRHVAWSGEPVHPRPPSALEGFVIQLESAGIPATHCLHPDVSWMADDMSDFLLQERVARPYIVLIPGCSGRHPEKRWPYYAELAAVLIERGYEVVTAPGPDEIELAKTIPGHTFLGPNGFLNWFELAGVLKDACFVVGNDTGPSHVASCLGKPGLALFGPHTTAARTGICRGDFSAIEVSGLAGLSVETVLETMLPKLPVAQENSV
jgi:ADP-heptose:LPS heptosyltransferase